jgi:hypothetical protein
LWQKNYVKNSLAILSIAGGYLLLVAGDYYLSGQHIILCFFKRFTHIPCPGCGMGRATLELARGAVAASLSYHLLCIPVTLVVAIALICLLKDVFKNQETLFVFLSRRSPFSIRVLLFTVIVFCWVVNIVRRV